MERELSDESTATNHRYTEQGTGSSRSNVAVTFLVWLVANIAAAFVAWGASILLHWVGGILVGVPQQDLPNWGWEGVSAITAVVSGALYGFAQWLVLRRHLSALRWQRWVSISALAYLGRYIVSFLLGAALLAALQSFLFGKFTSRSDSSATIWTVSASQATIGLILGALVGWLQWLVLRRHVLRAGWWIAGLALGELASAAMYKFTWNAAFSAGGSFDPSLLAVLNTLISALLVPLFSGVVLMYLLRQHSRRSVSTQARIAQVESANTITGQPPGVGVVTLTDVEPAEKGLALRAWPYLLVANLVLGLLLSFFYFTDYSLPGSLLDLLLPPLLFALGIAAFMWAGYAPGRTKRWVGKLSALPSLLGGALYLVAVGLIFMPPTTLRGMFLADEIATEVLLQQVASPDGSRVAEVYYRPGGYGGATFKPAMIRVHYTLFPLVERDVLSRPVSGSPIEPDTEPSYVMWSDNDTLFLPGTGDSVELGLVRWEVPVVFAAALPQPGRWADVAERQQKTEEETEANTVEVSQVPAYPGKRTSEHIEFRSEENTQFRSYNIEDISADEVTQWYKQALSQPPWSVVRSDRYTGDSLGSPYTRDCIRAKRVDNGDQDHRVYYIEVMGEGDKQKSIHVNIGTPHPITEACKRWAE